MSQLEVLVPVRESEARAYLGPFRRHAETSPSRPLSMPLLTLDGHATSVYDRRFSLDGHPVPLRISLHPAARHLNISVPSPPSAATSSESLGLSNTNLAPSPTPKRTHPLHPIQEKTSISSTSPSRDASHSISNVNMTPSLTLPASVPHATILEISNTFSGQALEQRGQLVPTFTPTDSISAAQFSTVIPFSMPDAALTTSSIPDCEIFSNEAAELLLMDNVLKLSNSYDGEFVTPQSDVDAESERSPVPPLRSSSKIPFVIMENTLLSEAMPAESIGQPTSSSLPIHVPSSDEDALKVLAHAPAIQFQQMETEEQGPEGLLMKTLSDDTSIKSLTLSSKSLSVRCNLPSIKVLQVLKPEEARHILETAANWPVAKSGFLLKTSGQHNFAGHTHRIGHARSFASVLKEAAGKALHLKSSADSVAFPLFQREEEDLSLFYVEIREHYLFLYTISATPLLPSITLNSNLTSKTASPPPPPPPPPLLKEARSDSLLPTKRTTSREGPKTISKFLGSFAKKTQQYVQNKRQRSMNDLRNHTGKGLQANSVTSVALGAMPSRPSSPHSDREPKYSSESNRSIHGMPMHDLRRGTRTLFSYICLKNAIVDLRVKEAPKTSSESSRTSAVGSQILLTIPCHDSHGGKRQSIHTATLQFEVVCDISETTSAGAGDNHELSVTSLASVLRNESLAQRKEAEEWHQVIIEAIKKEKWATGIGGLSVKSVPESSSSFRVGESGSTKSGWGTVGSTTSSRSHVDAAVGSSAGAKGITSLFKTEAASESLSPTNSLLLTPPKSPRALKTTEIASTSTTPFTTILHGGESSLPSAHSLSPKPSSDTTLLYSATDPSTPSTLPSAFDRGSYRSMSALSYYAPTSMPVPDRGSQKSISKLFGNWRMTHYGSGGFSSSGSSSTSLISGPMATSVQTLGSPGCGGGFPALSSSENNGVNGGVHGSPVASGAISSAESPASVPPPPPPPPAPPVSSLPVFAGYTAARRILHSGGAGGLSGAKPIISGPINVKKIDLPSELIVAMSHQGSAHASYRTTEPTPIRPLRARSSSAGLTLENMAGLAMSSPSVETQNFPFPSASVTAASPLTTSTQVAIEIERPSVWKYYWKSSNAEESSGIMSRINGKSTYHGIDKSDKEPAAGGPVTVLSQPKESSKKEKKEKEKEQKAKDRLSKVKDTRRMDTLFGDRPLSTDHGDVYQTLASPTANLSSSSLSSDILTFPTVSSTPQTTTVPAPASKNFFPFFHRPLWAQRPVAGSSGGVSKSSTAGFKGSSLLHRSGTAVSRGSTLRRRIAGGRERPPSAGTQISLPGTLASSYHAPAEVPLILRKCIRLIEEIGLDTEGLYRISGSAITVEYLRKLFDADPAKVHLRPPPSVALMSSLSSPQFQDHHPSLLRRASRLSLTETVSSMRTSSDVYISMRPGGSSGQRVVESSAMKPVTSLKQQEQSTVKHQQNKVEDCKKATPLFASSSLYDNDVHVVTGVVKWFLRDGLPPIGEPVCTHELYEGFVAAAQLDVWRDRMIAVQDMVHHLPPIHFETLKFVCEHLQRVSACSSQNRMTVKNLSIIFGPTLFRPPPALDTIQRIMNDMPFQCKVVETLLEQVEWIFGPIEYEHDEENASDEFEFEDSSLGLSNSQFVKGGNAGLGYFDLFETDLAVANRARRDVSPTIISDAGSHGSLSHATGSMSDANEMKSVFKEVPLSPRLFDASSTKRDRRRGHLILEATLETSSIWEKLRGSPARRYSDEMLPNPDEERVEYESLRRRSDSFFAWRPSLDKRDSVAGSQTHKRLSASGGGSIFGAKSRFSFDGSASLRVRPSFDVGRGEGRGAYGFRHEP